MQLSIKSINILMKYQYIMFISDCANIPVAGQNLSSYNVTHDDPCKCISEINGTLKEQPCTEWKYDDSVFESTLVTQVTVEASAESLHNLNGRNLPAIKTVQEGL